MDTSLRCITTGIAAAPSVNVEESFSVSMKMLEDMAGKEVNEYTFLVSLKAKTLATRPVVTFDGKNVSADPQLLFQRLSVASSTQTEEAEQDAFGYELCPYLPALFDKGLLMRYGAKSKLAPYRIS